MNPERLYSQMKMDSLVDGIEAKEYSTFVAMPFFNRFGYDSLNVFKTICAAVEAINNIPGLKLEKKFSCPIRVDQGPSNASDITEEIADKIMKCHFFIGDLTWANHGALVETGIALALKPSSSIFLMAQGRPTELHFDISVNRVNFYDNLKPKRIRENIQNALIASAHEFEARLGSGFQAFRQELTPESLLLLNLYGHRRIRDNGNSIHIGCIDEKLWIGNFGKDRNVRLTMYNRAIQHLLEKRLLALDYKIADDGISPDMHGFHATKFGAAFLRHTWPRAFKNVGSIWD